MTQKVVQAPEHELSVLRTRIEKLEQQVIQLQKNNEKPAKRSSALFLMNHHRDSERRNSHKSSTGESPSFARPTRASHLRQSSTVPSTESTPARNITRLSSRTENAVKGSHRAIFDGKPQYYRDGKLVERPFGYLVSTKATINRFGFNEQLREQRCGVAHLSFATSWGAPNVVDWPEARVESPQPAIPTQRMTQEMLEDEIEQQGIAVRTRLLDNAWVRDPANNVYIDHDEQFDILCKAEKEVKLCYWKWLRINRPKKCESLGLYSLSDMDLGRCRLGMLTENTMNFYSYRHTTTEQVEGALEGIILLRNRTHHFTGSTYTVPSYEEQLYSVQLLAVLFYDEKAAKMARSLRDRLLQAAQGVAREIEALRLFTPLPFPETFPWRPHHLNLFSRVNSERDVFGDEYIRQHYSPSVDAAALEHSETVDYTFWDREPDEEENLATMQEALASIEASIATVHKLENGGGRVETRCGSETRRGGVHQLRDAHNPVEECFEE